jgi:hypothetical protein
MDRPLTTRRLALLMLAAAVAGSMVARAAVKESTPGVLRHAVVLLAVR